MINICSFKNFWEKVVYHRTNGHDDLLPKKRVSKDKATPKYNNTCLIESDDDQPVKTSINNSCYVDQECIIDSEDDQPITAVINNSSLV